MQESGESCGKRKKYENEMPAVVFNVKHILPVRTTAGQRILSKHQGLFYEVSVIDIDIFEHYIEAVGINRF